MGLGCAVADMQSYVEEWAKPPVPSREQQRAWGDRKHREPLISWLLWWPTQMLIRQCKLVTLCDS